MPASRGVSLAAGLQYAISSTAFTNAVALGDCDNDGDNELIVASADGALRVFKGGRKTAWRTWVGQGTFTSVAIGDACNDDQNVIVAVTAEGGCAIYKVPAESESGSTDLPGPVVWQRVPVNSKTLLIADVTGDGKLEVVIGRTDRKVLALVWSPMARKLLPLWEVDLPGQIGTIAMVSAKSAISSSSHPAGNLLGISQPGCTLQLVDHNGTLQKKVTSAFRASESSTIDGVTTEVVSGIRGGVGEELLTALCSSAGLVKVGTVDRLSWKAQLDRPLFALAKVDVTGDGVDELVACAWDGRTAIVDHQQNVVEYSFGSELCAFTSGYYAVEQGKNEPCLVYVTLLDPETNQCTVSIRHSLGIRTVKGESLPQTVPTSVQNGREALEACGIAVDTNSMASLIGDVLAAAPRLQRERDILTSTSVGHFKKFNKMDRSPRIREGYKRS